jgi:hypothetical protein
MQPTADLLVCAEVTLQGKQLLELTVKTAYCPTSETAITRCNVPNAQRYF